MRKLIPIVICTTLFGCYNSDINELQKRRNDLHNENVELMGTLGYQQGVANGMLFGIGKITSEELDSLEIVCANTRHNLLQ